MQDQLAYVKPVVTVGGAAHATDRLEALLSFATAKVGKTYGLCQDVNNEWIRYYIDLWCIPLTNWHMHSVRKGCCPELFRVSL
jgi:hypothetical protein